MAKWGLQPSGTYRCHCGATLEQLPGRGGLKCRSCGWMEYPPLKPGKAEQTVLRRRAHEDTKVARARKAGPHDARGYNRKRKHKAREDS